MRERGGVGLLPRRVTPAALSNQTHRSSMNNPPPHLFPSLVAISEGPNPARLNSQTDSAAASTDHFSVRPSDAMTRKELSSSRRALWTWGSQITPVKLKSPNALFGKREEGGHGQKQGTKRREYFSERKEQVREKRLSAHLVMARPESES
jgi:hypothetical protein